MSGEDLVKEFTELKEKFETAKGELISVKASVASKKEIVDELLKELKGKGVNSLEELQKKIEELELDIKSGLDKVKTNLGE